MEHPLIRLKAATGLGTVAISTRVARAATSQSARTTWSYWLRGKRAPNSAQLGRLVQVAHEVGQSELAVELLRWGAALALELEEAPTVALTPEQLAEDARADARLGGADDSRGP